MEFEWEEDKAAANLAKHGVSFQEAETIFADPLYVDLISILPARAALITAPGRRPGQSGLG
jgi:uncharacterized DUF497 family protein